MRFRSVSLVSAAHGPRGKTDGFMSLTNRILAALVAGLVCGALLGRFGGGAQATVLPVVQTIGSAWLGGLRMTIVPLVFVLLVTGVASAADAARAGSVAGRALLFFAIGLFASALVSGLAIEAMLKVWPVQAGALDVLGSGAPAVPAGSTSISGEWLLSFIPVNPIKSAAEGEMVPVVVFALLFGFAVTRTAREGRTTLLGVLQAISDALLVIVHWVLWLAPIGVFALALMAGAKAGFAAAGTLAQYVAFIVASCALVTLLVYPVVVICGRIGLRRFARTALPAQAIALSTQSSIASLPAMIEAVGRLGVAEPVRNMVLPMAVSVFRVTSAAANIAVALYVAALHGIPIGPVTFGIGVVVATIVSLAAVGLPSQVSFFTAIGPVCLAMGVPVDLLPLLLAVETIPDIFRTIGNVTADIAVSRIVAARSPSGAVPAD